jgi:pilus assembly protein CpaE
MNGFQLARTWKILLLGPGDEQASSLRTLLSQEAPAAQVFEVKAYPDTAKLPQLLSSQALSLCFLDVTSSRETALPLIREIHQIAPRLPVIALIQADDPDLILGCLRQGAVDFLIFPSPPAQIAQVFTRVVQRFPELAPTSSYARTIAVMPVKGACGASTVALNLAFQKKRLGVKRLLLADLDPLTGTLAFMLRAKPTYSFLDAMSRGTTLDHDVWKSLVQNIDGTDVLLSPDVIVEALYQLGDPAPMIEFARTCYDLMILDLASPYGPWNHRIAQLSDEIFLVSTADAVGLRSAQRALAFLSNHQISPSKVRMIINRFSRNVSLGADVFETSLQRQLFAKVHEDGEAVQRALIDAKPVAPGCAFSKDMVALADALAGPKSVVPDTKPTPKPGALMGLLALFGKKASP